MVKAFIMPELELREHDMKPGETHQYDGYTVTYAGKLSEADPTLISDMLGDLLK